MDVQSCHNHIKGKCGFVYLDKDGIPYCGYYSTPNSIVRIEQVNNKCDC